MTPDDLYQAISAGNIDDIVAVINPLLDDMSYSKEEIHVIISRAVDLAVEKKSNDSIREIIEPYKGHTFTNSFDVLMMACSEGFTSLTRYLIDDGTPLIYEEESALLMAGLYESMPIMAILIEEGADPKEFEFDTVITLATQGLREPFELLSKHLTDEDMAYVAEEIAKKGVALPENIAPIFYLRLHTPKTAEHKRQSIKF